MKKQWPNHTLLPRVTAMLVLALTLASGGCSTYTTNTKLTFSSTVLNNQKPDIYVGEITETPDQLTFLGTVDATVRRPNMFEPEPTPEQANIVLGYLGKKKNADAVIHVTYKPSVSGSKIDATGQAVKINGPHSYNQPKNSVQMALEKFGITPDALTPEAAPPAILAPGDPATATPSADSATIAPPNTGSIAPSGSPIPGLIGQKPVMDEKVYALARALAEAEAKAQAKVDTERADEEFRQLDAEADINAINIMISTARTLLDYSSKYNDPAMKNIITRLIQNLEHHLQKHERAMVPSP